MGSGSARRPGTLVSVLLKADGTSHIPARGRDASSFLTGSGEGWEMVSWAAVGGNTAKIWWGNKSFGGQRIGGGLHRCRLQTRVQAVLELSCRQRQAGSAWEK